MKTLFAFCLTIMTFSSFAFASAQTMEMPTYNIAAFNKKVTLKAGTIIMLETAESLQSNRMSVGQLIQFKVKTDVYAEGKLVVRTGALALGRVKNIQKATYNNPEFLTIEITTVQAVDGQTITLNSTEQTIKGVYAGQGSTMQKGTMISANVMNDYEVKFK